MIESTDTVEEIYLERERYLVNTDDLLEEEFGKYQSNITENIKMGFCHDAKTVCFGALIDIDEMFGHEIKKYERFPVCINCREFVEAATA